MNDEEWVKLWFASMAVFILSIALLFFGLASIAGAISDRRDEDDLDEADWWKRGDDGPK